MEESRITVGSVHACTCKSSTVYHERSWHCCLIFPRRRVPSLTKHYFAWFFLTLWFVSLLTVSPNLQVSDLCPVILPFKGYGPMGPTYISNARSFQLSLVSSCTFNSSLIVP